MVLIKVVDGSRAVFYEYVRPPCVYLSFHNEGMMARRFVKQSGEQCYDPNTPAGIPACCGQPTCVTEWADGSGSSYNTCSAKTSVGTRRRRGPTRDTSLDWAGAGRRRGSPGKWWSEPGAKRYQNVQSYELTTFATAKARCLAEGMRLCPWFSKNHWSFDYYVDWAKDHIWIDRPCRVQVEVDDLGAVSIIHVGSTQPEFSLGASATSGNTFQVKWDGNSQAFPRASTGCAANCTIPEKNGKPGNTCLCETEVRETPVFHEATGHHPGP